MNTIEDRIRAAARAAADAVPPDGVPPLRLPAGQPARPFWRGPARTSSRTWARRLAPAAAAAAVIAIVGAVIAVVQGGLGGPPRSQTPVANVPTASPTGTPTAAITIPPQPKLVAGPPVSSYVSSGQIPPYYVVVTSHGNPDDNPSYAVVHDTVTGKALATIQPSAPGGTIVAVTAAADDRTFVLDEQPLVTAPGGNQSWAARTFYQVRLDSSGRPGAVTRLPVSLPSGHMLTGLALSPDGHQLALAVEVVNDKKNPNLVQLTVDTLATGASRTWTGSGTIGFAPDDARSLSWTTDGRTLAFSWEGTGSQRGVWFLDPARSGGDLLADSRQAVSWPRISARLSCQEDTIITPDGSAIVCGAQNMSTPGPAQEGETAYLEFSAATGKLTRVLGDWTFTGNPSPELLWSGSSGTVLIGIAGPHDQVGVISGNRFTPLHAKMGFYPDDSGTW